MKGKNIYFIGIGGIGISAIARYYLSQGANIYGTDKNNSELIMSLQKQGCHITLGNTFFSETSDVSLENIDKIIYTEAVPLSHPELIQAKELGIEIQSYPESLAEIANNKKLIAIAGTHGKSTTTSLTSLVLKNSEEGFSSIVGSLLKEFNGTNFFQRKSTHPENDYFVIEACEYKRSFLRYKPTVGVIVNIEIDHLDYYKDLEDYISAYKSFINNIKSGGFCILNGEDENCKKLLGIRNDISYIEIYSDKYIIYQNPENLEQKEEIFFPEITMQVPGTHILFDACIAYVVGIMIGIHEHKILDALEDYTGIWRRMEKIGFTQNRNLLMSDYGHHPTEISLTLKALKEKYPEKYLYTVFQPHQYNRTLELLEDFKDCFGQTDTLIIPNIYESRDSEEDKQKINSKKLVEYINHDNAFDGEGLENTLELIQNFDSKNSSAIILLLGAGNVDELRYKIKTS